MIAEARLSFTHLLGLTGLNLEKVKLFRHAETQRKTRSPFQLWLISQEKQEDSFNLYQSIQPFKVKMDRRYIASFVVASHNETLFVGMYENYGSLGYPPEGTLCPVGGHPVHEGHNLYDLRLTEHLKEYRGRLVIDWGKGALSWGQNADNDSPKFIKEIRCEQAQAEFPGFERFVWPIKEIDRLPHAWAEVLKNTQGVYLLTCLDTGKRYVGSAYGEEKLLGRWQAYYKSGHGGNKQLISHQTSGYQVSVLEVASSADGVSKIVERENNWKEKLLSRHPQFGLNDN